MSAISLRGLTKRFGNVLAVDDLGLEVADGELIALLGPSGCGKTTTLRSIAGFEAPDAGIARLQRPAHDGAAAEQRDVGIVLQSYALFLIWTVWDDVAFGLEIADHGDQRTGRRRPGRVRSPGSSDEICRASSPAGQRAAAALARALIMARTCCCWPSRSPISTPSSGRRCSFYVPILQQEVRITTCLRHHDQRGRWSSRPGLR